MKEFHERVPISALALFNLCNVFSVSCTRFEEITVKVEESMKAETPSVEEPGIFQILEQLEEATEALLTR